MFNNINYHGFWHYQNILERFVTRRHEWCPTCQSLVLVHCGAESPRRWRWMNSQAERDTGNRRCSAPQHTPTDVHNAGPPPCFPCPQLATQAPPQSQDSSCLSSTSSPGKNWPSPSPAQHPEEAGPHLMPRERRQDSQLGRSGCSKLLRGLHLIPGVTGGSRMIKTCGYKG